MEIKRTSGDQRFSSVVEHNGTLYFAGLTSSKKTFEEQLLDILTEFETRAKNAGSDRSRILSALVILKDMKDFAELNKVWIDWFGGKDLPTRATFQAEMAREDILVEIVFTAATGA